MSTINFFINGSLHMIHCFNKSMAVLPLANVSGGGWSIDAIESSMKIVTLRKFFPKMK